MSPGAATCPLPVFGWLLLQQSYLVAGATSPNRHAECRCIDDKTVSMAVISVLCPVNSRSLLANVHTSPAVAHVYMQLLVCVVTYFCCRCVNDLKVPFNVLKVVQCI